jgi:putative transposase
LDILVQSQRDKKAAKKFFRKLLKGLQYVPRVIITDELKSYNAAKTEVPPSVEHCQQKDQNNRAENSHQPTRLRERVLRRFKSSGHAQRFLSVFGIISSHFRVGRHRYRARGYREMMKSRFALWAATICVSRRRKLPVDQSGIHLVSPSCVSSCVKLTKPSDREGAPS